MDPRTLLRGLPLLAGISDEAVAALVPAMRETRLASGDVLFSEGDPSTALYIVASGAVIIYRELAPGQVKSLAVLEPGSVFGEMALFADELRTACARAREDSIVFALDRAAFLELLAGRPGEGVNILSSMLRSAMTRLEETSRELATVYETGRAIAAGDSLSGVALAVHDQLLLAVPSADHAAIFVYNEFNLEFDPAAGPASLGPLSPHDPLARAAMNAPCAALTPPAGLTGPLGKAASLAAARMTSAGKPLGFLILWNTRTTQGFSASTCLLLGSVAGQLAEAIANIRTREEEANRRRLNARRGY